MDLQEVRQYHPQTSNGANSDRKYFISGSNFIKIDKIIERGQSEARILSSVSHPLYKNTLILISLMIIGTSLLLSTFKERR